MEGNVRLPEIISPRSPSYRKKSSLSDRSSSLDERVEDNLVSPTRPPPISPYTSPKGHSFREKHVALDTDALVEILDDSLSHILSPTGRRIKTGKSTSFREKTVRHRGDGEAFSDKVVDILGADPEHIKREKALKRLGLTEDNVSEGEKYFSTQDQRQKYQEMCTSKFAARLLREIYNRSPNGASKLIKLVGEPAQNLLAMKAYDVLGTTPEEVETSRQIKLAAIGERRGKKYTDGCLPSL